MIIFKVQRSWRHVGPLPLFRALVVDGATYYLIFILAFVLELIANASDVVCKAPLDCLLIGAYSWCIALLSHSGHQVCSNT